MHADDVFRYGHLTILRVVDGFPEECWDVPGACGAWTPRDILAHLASYEMLIGDVLSSILSVGPTPTLDRFLTPEIPFNETEVAERAQHSATALLGEYETAHRRAADLLAQIPLQQRREAGILAWYGVEYDLEDAIAYIGYGHKQEHGAQLAAARTLSPA